MIERETPHFLSRRLWPRPPWRPERVRLGLLLCLLLGVGTFADSALAASSAERCEALKNRQAGKYALCRAKVLRNALLRDKPKAYDSCVSQLEKGWAKLEETAQRRGNACPTENDLDAIERAVFDQETTLETALAGFGLPECGDGVVNVVGEQCDGSDTGGRDCQDLGFEGGPLGCTDQCDFETSGCIVSPDTCGNGVLDDDEDCDFGVLRVGSCSLATGGDRPVGSLACGAHCFYDTGDCQRSCPQLDENGPCWVLGELGASCADTCGQREQVYDDATRTFAGSDPAEPTGCGEAFPLAAGLDNEDQFSFPFPGPWPCSLGLGCAVESNLSDMAYCSEPMTTAEAASPGIRRVCACSDP